MNSASRLASHILNLFQQCQNSQAWMCGGKIEIVPCSRVGHIFRTFSPYKWTTTVKLPEYNYKRVAAVWMDHYQELYYDRIGRTGDRREQNIGDYGSVLARKELRESLQCKDFEWCVCDKICDHIFPPVIICLYQVSERTNARLAQRSDQGDGGDKVQLFENNALLANSNKT